MLYPLVNPKQAGFFSIFWSKIQHKTSKSKRRVSQRVVAIFFISAPRGITGAQKEEIQVDTGGRFETYILVDHFMFDNTWR